MVGRRVTDVERDTWQDLGLDDEHILQLGRIAIALSNIEYLTTNMLLPLIGQDGWAGRLVVGGEPPHLAIGPDQAPRAISSRAGACR